LPILGIDPGDHTGYAIVDNKQIITTGEIIYTQKKKLKHMEELLYLDAIRKIYREFKPDLVVIETNFMGRFIAVVKALTKKLVIITLAVKMEYPEALIIPTAPQEWKKLLDIPPKTKYNLTPEKEKVQAKIRELLLIEKADLSEIQKITDNEHISDSVAMCFAYEGKVRIKR